jgi:hypothetical protein
MRGGSLASSAVMKLVQNNCATSATEMNSPKVDFIYKDVVNNYGSIYRMTGGASAEQPEQPEQPEQKLDDSMWSKFTMVNANRFLRKTLNNRILDIYLKYLGVTLLTPATLVPIALFMGQRTFNKVMMNIKKNDSKIQKGGRGFLDKPHIPIIKEIPILDDEIMGKILKISGLFALGSISPYTLIPVGLLMVLYEKYGADVLKIPKALRSTSIRASKSSTSRSKSQVAGQLLRRHLRQHQRGGQCEEGPRPNLDWRDVGNTFVHHSNKPVSQFMSGGSREPWPNSIPQNLFQVAENIYTGQYHHVNRGAPYQNHDMQVSTNGLPSQLDIKIPYADHMEGAGLPSCGGNPSLSSTQCSGLPRAMAGGNSSGSKNRRRNTRQTRHKRSTRNRRQMRGGASSDWRSMLYSLGPTNTVDMPSAQFKAFSQTTPQTPNSALNGGFNGTSNFYNYDSYRNVNDYTPLYTQGVTGQIPQSNMELGSCGSGVPAARF